MYRTDNVLIFKPYLFYHRIDLLKLSDLKNNLTKQYGIPAKPARERITRNPADPAGHTIREYQGPTSRIQGEKEKKNPALTNLAPNRHKTRNKICGWIVDI